MEETKIWVVEGNSATELDSANQVVTEELLESILTANPGMLKEGLRLVGRQTSTAGGPLDLLGVDTDGRLVVFELKRGTLNREAVAQVIDYASSLNAMEPDRLRRHIEEQSGKFEIKKIEDFEEWYRDFWKDSELPEEGLESLTPPRMVLVGLGVDDATARMVNFMASGGVDISLVAFNGFVSNDDKTLLSRNIEVNSAKVPNKSHLKPRLQFVERVEKLNRSQLLNTMTDLVRKGFDNPHIGDSTYQRSFRFSPPGGQGASVYTYIKVDEANNCLKLGYSPVAIKLIPDEFDKIQVSVGEIEKPRAFSKVIFSELGYDYDVEFYVHSDEEWDVRKEQITDLTHSVYKAYQQTYAE